MSKHPIVLSAVAGLAAWAAMTCLPIQQAAAEDPQARSVRQWFAFLVDEEARPPGVAGKRTLLEAAEADRRTRSAPPQDHAKWVPGRQTLVMREGRMAAVYDNKDLTAETLVRAAAGIAA